MKDISDNLGNDSKESNPFKVFKLPNSITFDKKKFLSPKQQPTMVYNWLVGKANSNNNKQYKDCFTVEEFNSMLRKAYFVLDQIRQTNMSTEAHIRAIFDFCFSYYSLLKSKTRISANIGDLYIENLKFCPSMYKKKVKVVGLKINGATETGRVIRTSTLENCPVFAMALYFFNRFEVYQETPPDFSNRECLLELALLTKTNSSEHLNSTVLNKAVERFLNKVSTNLFLKKVDLSCNSACKHATELNLGSFNMMNVHNTVLQPISYLYQISGHNYSGESQKPKIILERACLNYEGKVFKSIESKIFPWLKAYVNGSGIDLCSRDIFNLLSYLRKVIIEDMVEYYLTHNTIIFNNSIFGSSDFKYIAETVKLFKNNPDYFTPGYYISNLRMKELDVIDKRVLKSNFQN